jgi:5-methylcytosine-specific restriction endonuclease McrA
MAGGRADYRALPRGENGRLLCRWCRVEVPKGRRSFCSDHCVHAWRLRTDTSYLRTHVFHRDRGICAYCTVDTRAAWAQLRRSRGKQRKFLLGYWGLKKISRKSLWDADHIVPVAEGGGECDLSNLRTLCLACHKMFTGELRTRLSRNRAAMITPTQSCQAASA